MTAEEKLMELYKERDLEVTEKPDGTMLIHGQGSVCVSPADIDLIANLVVERLGVRE